jgi:hypothetical protein
VREALQRLEQIRATNGELLPIPEPEKAEDGPGSMPRSRRAARRRIRSSISAPPPPIREWSARSLFVEKGSAVLLLSDPQVSGTSDAVLSGFRSAILAEFRAAADSHPSPIPYVHFPAGWSTGVESVRDAVRRLPSEAWWPHCNVLVEAAALAECGPSLRRTARFIAIRLSADIIGPGSQQYQLNAEFDGLIDRLASEATNPPLQILIRDRRLNQIYALFGS